MFKRILLWTLGAFVVLVALVLVVGMTLARDHVATVYTVIDAEPAELRQAIVDVESHPEWRPSVRRIEGRTDEGGRLRWREVGETGTIPMEMTIAAPTRIVTEILDEGMPFGGRWIYELKRVPEGTEVTITEQGKVYNPVFRFVSHFFMDSHATAEIYLQDLGRRFGQDVDVSIYSDF